MTVNETISHKTILDYLIGLLTIRNPNNSYKDEYNYVFSEVVKKIKNSEIITAGHNNKIKIGVTDTIKRMSDVSSLISVVINQYFKGRISDANWMFKTHLEKIHIPKYDDEECNRVFYRMRNRKEEENIDFGPSDLLHISIHKRDNISNQRFSINGFPCLYASTSLYQCWEELRRPHLQNLYASGILFTDNLRLLDLRLIRSIDNEKQLVAFMTRLPLIIACSIKTRNDKAAFKEEYIIPQILLHTTINIKYNIDGIIYSSMRKDYDYYNADCCFEDFSKNENIVIPAKVTSANNNYADNLLKLLEISRPLNFEQELIRGTISPHASTLYEGTLFGQMEQQIVSTKIFKAFNTQMLSIHNVSQRMKELTNSIIIL